MLRAAMLSRPAKQAHRSRWSCGRACTTYFGSFPFSRKLPRGRALAAGSRGSSHCDGLRPAFGLQTIGKRSADGTMIAPLEL